MTMQVNSKNARYCCRFCFPEYGHSDRGHDKVVFRRMLKRRERAAWKKEATND